MDATAMIHKIGLAGLLAGDEALEMHDLDQIQAGIPVGALEAFLETGVLAREDAVHCIGSDRTIARRRQEGRLSATESDRFFRLARLTVLAIDVFGNSDKARQWLYTPNKALEGRLPKQLLDTDLGARLVEKILGRIAQGVYS